MSTNDEPRIAILAMPPCFGNLYQMTNKQCKVCVMWRQCSEKVWGIHRD